MRLPSVLLALLVLAGCVSEAPSSLARASDTSGGTGAATAAPENLTFDGELTASAAGLRFVFDLPEPIALEEGHGADVTLSWEGNAPSGLALRLREKDAEPLQVEGSSPLAISVPPAAGAREFSVWIGAPEGAVVARISYHGEVAFTT